MCWNRLFTCLSLPSESGAHWRPCLAGWLTHLLFSELRKPVHWREPVHIMCIFSLVLLRFWSHFRYIRSYKNSTEFQLPSLHFPMVMCYPFLSFSGYDHAFGLPLASMGNTEPATLLILVLLHIWLFLFLCSLWALAYYVALGQVLVAPLSSGSYLGTGSVVDYSWISFPYPCLKYLDVHIVGEKRQLWLGGKSPGFEVRSPVQILILFPPCCVIMEVTLLLNLFLFCRWAW